MPACRWGWNASAPRARSSPNWTRADSKSSAAARLGRVGRENRDHVAIDLALEGNDQLGKLGHFRPAPRLELGLMAIARRDIDLAFLTQKAHREPFLALPPVAPLQGHAQEFARQVIAEPTRCLGDDLDRADGGLLLQFAQGRRAFRFVRADATLRHLPDVAGAIARPLGPAPADPHQPVAVDQHDPDTGAVGQIEVQLRGHQRWPKSMRAQANSSVA